MTDKSQDLQFQSNNCNFYGNAFLIMKLSKRPSFRAIRALIASQSTYETLGFRHQPFYFGHSIIGLSSFQPVDYKKSLFHGEARISKNGEKVDSEENIYGMVSMANMAVLPGYDGNTYP